MDIPELNDDCLRLILEQLPIPQVVHLRRVSRQWLLIGTLVLHSSRSLKLFANQRDLEQFHNALLKYNLTRDSSDFCAHQDDCVVVNGKFHGIIKAHRLAAFFPQLDSLLLSGAKSRIDYGSFLKRYQTLSCVALFQLGRVDHLEEKILPRLQSMSALTSLHLFELKSEAIPAKFLSLFTRLQQLTLTDYSCSLWPVFEQFSTNLKQLRLYDVAFAGTDQLMDLFSPQSCSKFSNLTHLGVGDFSTTYRGKLCQTNLLTTLDAICQQFSGLCYLDCKFMSKLRSEVWQCLISSTEN